VLSSYDQNYIIQTFKSCKKYFKEKAVSNKVGFFLQALKQGYYAQENPKGQRESKPLTNYPENEKSQIVDPEIISKLREEYMTMELAKEILDTFKGHFLYPIMERDFLE